MTKIERKERKRKRYAASQKGRNICIREKLTTRERKCVCVRERDTERKREEKCVRERHTRRDKESETFKQDKEKKGQREMDRE